MKTRAQYAAAQSTRKRLAIVDRVIEQLRQHGPMTATGLAGRLGLTAQSVSVALFHESKDRVSVVRNGERRLIYFLPTAHQVDLASQGWDAVRAAILARLQQDGPLSSRQLSARLGVHIEVIAFALRSCYDTLEVKDRSGTTPRAYRLRGDSRPWRPERHGSKPGAVVRARRISDLERIITLLNQHGPLTMTRIVMHADGKLSRPRARRAIAADPERRILSEQRTGHGCLYRLSGDSREPEEPEDDDDAATEQLDCNDPWMDEEHRQWFLRATALRKAREALRRAERG